MNVGRIMSKNEYKNLTKAEYQKLYYKNNKEKVASWKKTQYLKDKEKIKSYNNLRKEDKKEIDAKYYLRNREKILTKKRKYYAENREKEIFRSLKYKLRKIKASPLWLYREQIDQIKSFYDLAKECEMLTNDKYHVDHIIPLKGENVCGLHVPWNLQVLPAAINISKGNR